MASYFISKCQLYSWILNLIDYILMMANFNWQVKWDKSNFYRRWDFDIWWASKFSASALMCVISQAKSKYAVVSLPHTWQKSKIISIMKYNICTGFEMWLNMNITYLPIEKIKRSMQCFRVRSHIQSTSCSMQSAVDISNTLQLFSTSPSFPLIGSPPRGVYEFQLMLWWLLIHKFGFHSLQS